MSRLSSNLAYASPLQASLLVPAGAYADVVEIEGSRAGAFESQQQVCFFTVITFRHRASLMTGAGS
jgi:hypothetical protein